MTKFQDLIVFEHARIYWHSQDGNNRYEKYLKSWESFYKIRLYEADDKRKQRPIEITKQIVDGIAQKYELNQTGSSEVYFVVHKHTHKGQALVEIELRYPYGTKEINGIKLYDFNDVINWNEFTTEVCIGDGHKDSCDDTSGKVLVVDYRIIYIVSAFNDCTSNSLALPQLSIDLSSNNL